MSSLHDLQKLVITLRDERDWKQFHNPKDLAISLSLEAAEVMEHFQWKNTEETTEHVQTHKKEIGYELSDLMYIILLFANDLDINLEEVFIEKLEKIKEKYPIELSKGNHKKYTEFLR